MCFSKGTKPDVPILGILMHSRKGSEPKGRGCDLPSDREEGSVFQSGSLEGCVTEWSGHQEQEGESGVSTDRKGLQHLWEAQRPPTSDAMRWALTEEAWVLPTHVASFPSPGCPRKPLMGFRYLLVTGNELMDASFPIASIPNNRARTAINSSQGQLAGLECLLRPR